MASQQEILDTALDTFTNSLNELWESTMTTLRECAACPPGDHEDLLLSALEYFIADVEDERVRDEALHAPV